MNKTLKTLLVLVAVSLTSTAQATLFKIDTVASGSSGFGASSFHDASGVNPMSGPHLADITLGSGLFGTYNDVTGAVNASLSITQGGSFTLAGILAFDNNGLLAANSVLNVDFTGSTLSDTTIGYLPGYVCCGNTNFDPNSFKFEASSNKMVMTLWGADFGQGDFTGSYDGAQLGMDIRLKMTAVPEPSILALLSLGLIGLFVTGRNKKA